MPIAVQRIDQMLSRKVNCLPIWESGFGVCQLQQCYSCYMGHESVQLVQYIQLMNTGGSNILLSSTCCHHVLDIFLDK